MNNSLIFQIIPKSHNLFGLLLLEKLSTIPFKNSPIWSPWLKWLCSHSSLSGHGSGTVVSANMKFESFLRQVRLQNSVIRLRYF